MLQFLQLSLTYLQSLRQTQYFEVLLLQQFGILFILTINSLRLFSFKFIRFKHGSAAGVSLQQNFLIGLFSLWGTQSSNTILGWQHYIIILINSIIKPSFLTDYSSAHDQTLINSTVTIKLIYPFYSISLIWKYIHFGLILYFVFFIFCLLVQFPHKTSFIVL